MLKNYYKILGLNNKANGKDINDAYHELAEKYRPDKHDNDPVYAEKFADIEEAYKTLSHPYTREAYNDEYEVLLNSQVIHREQLKNAQQMVQQHQQLNRQGSGGSWFGRMLAFLLIFSLGAWLYIQYDKSNINSSNHGAISNYNHISATTPDMVVKQWIEALGQREFKIAHTKMSRAYGGTFKEFTSPKRYGGVYKTKLHTCKLDKKIGMRDAIVIANYDSYDNDNRNGNFLQEFYLEETRHGWKIYRIKTINKRFF